MEGAAGQGPARRVWVVRAGKHDESFDSAVERGFCGIGWRELSDLSVLGEDGLAREVDVVYGHEPEGRIRNYKTQLRDFMQIRRGDLILMPNRADRQVAVGTVTGEYEHWPEGPDTANHIRPVQWAALDVPRELLGGLTRWVDRPVTVSAVPPAEAADLVEQMLADRQEIRLPEPPGTGDLHDFLEAVLAAVADNDDATAKRLVTSGGPTLLASVVGEDRPISGGAGIGTAAEVPWLTIHARGASGSSQEGYYVVYLFAADGSAAFLSLNQGTEKVKGGMRPLQKRALDLRAAAGLQDDELGTPIDLSSSVLRPRKYEAGNAYAVRYGRGSIPGDETLLDDLNLLLEYLDRARASGLEFDPEIEPLHLVFKWSSDREPQTVDLHRQVANAQGSVWWGKFGTGAVSEAKLSQLDEQLTRGLETHVYLYGGGSLFRTRLESITADPTEVDEQRVVDYYSTDECSLFARLSNFEELDRSWAIDNLLLASDPNSAKLQGALGNQTTPLFVYERHVRQGHPGGAMAVATLTMDWLKAETLWTTAALEELLAALDPATGKGQIILAGPPGTGKTWVAERFARFVTQDQPLQTRIVQFHPSYGYEEFVEGLRPVAKQGAISFERTDGLVLAMARKLEGTEAAHVLIIDELNRANIPRVFGELLYLLEYRGQDIDLQYSTGFELPENLRIIATMNTADRSIRSIDVALRRRFEIFECPADPEILAHYYEHPERVTDVPNLVEGFKALNDDLASRLDRHHTIGQSFFMAPDHSRAALERTWRRQVMPLIEEYFFDQPDVADDFSLEKFWPSA